MVAVALLKGSLKVEDYEEPIDPRIDPLRLKMEVIEEKEFSKDYLHPEKRSIGNSIQIFYTDESRSKEVTVEYPIGHPKRRIEALPLLAKKFQDNMLTHYKKDKVDAIQDFLINAPLDSPISDLLSLL
jgi:2-methylcitrate dehydratase